MNDQEESQNIEYFLKLVIISILIGKLRPSISMKYLMTWSELYV